MRAVWSHPCVAATSDAGLAVASRVRLGFMPLVDALPLVAASYLGLYAEYDLQVDLIAMRSWAQVRDALLLGQIDAAHCLPGIPLASQAGIFGDSDSLACALTLNHYGNAITLARSLHAELSATGNFDAALLRRALARRDTERPMTFASVFPVSKHEFELRHWLRQAGLTPGYDVNLLVIPPPMVVRALKERQIDGFCVGEPWNSLAVREGVGTVVSTSRTLDLPGTEKVLAASASWLHSAEHLALVASLRDTCAWLDAPEHRQLACDWLAEALQVERSCLEPSLLGVPEALGQVQPFVRFGGINRPDVGHARWLLGQIQQHSSLAGQLDAEAISARTFRADVYDLAAPLSS